MRKLLLIMAAVFISIAMQGQTVTKTKLLRTTDLGNQKLQAVYNNSDTLYAILIKTGNDFQKYLTVELGGYNDALRILNFLLDYEITNDDVISLDNPTDNLVKKNPLGGYLVYSEGRALNGQLRKGNIKEFLKALKDFANE